MLLRRRTAGLTIVAASLVWALSAGLAQQAARLQPPRAATQADLEALRVYMHTGWATLTRTPRDLPAAAVDPKLPPQHQRVPVYVSRREDPAAVRRLLAKILTPSELSSLDLRRLPASPKLLTEHGLLYLPRPYVVPGGRFNEMYGWDSYFILRGLLHDDEVQRAVDMTDDAIYEVVNFGTVLNANRTYYLERSQPPFLTAMIRDVFAVTHDRKWLASTLPAIRTQYRYWVTGAHLAGKTGLSRYHAFGSGPAPEVLSAERDAQGRTHYDRVRAALRADPADLRDPARIYDAASDTLTPLAYLTDRTVRESGFDLSDRFGRFGLDILSYAPVCLNSLLYAMERDMAAILQELGRGTEARTWTAAAERRARRVRALMWDEERGQFFDYDFEHGTRRGYTFATTFFPLWVGIATPEQARRVAETTLPLLMRPGGLMTSTRASGQQWDAPFGWAPLQLVAVEGLRRYGMDAEADRIALAFLGTVLKEYVEHGAVFEKYDVERRESDVAAGLRFGYLSNEIGFGWTNGVFLALEAGLAPQRRAEIVRAAAP
jgi:alpha,alpha-trehalase